MIDDFIITITDENRILTIKSDTKVLGSQYDNRVQRLVFIRPERYVSDELRLLFSDSSTTYAPVDIGTDNEFIITNALTQTLQLRLQIVIIRDGIEIEHSDFVSFTLRSSQKQDGQTAEPWSNPLKELSENAFVSVTYNDGILSFANLSGEETSSVEVSGGSYSPYIGDNGNWFEWSNDTDVFVDTGVRAQGLQGNTGPQGERGPVGANGYTPVRGVDYWTSTDVSTMKSELLTYIDGQNGTFLDVVNGEVI